MGKEKQSCWPHEQLKRPTEKRAHFSGMAFGSSADELFLADSANNVVRAFNLSTGQLAEHDVYRGSADGGYVESVAYSAPTDTLIVCMWRAEMLRTAHKVHSFARTNRADAEWEKRGRLYLQAMGRGVLRALSDGRVVFGGEFETQWLRVLEVNENQCTFEAGERISFESKHNGFDARLAPAGQRDMAGSRSEYRSRRPSCPLQNRRRSRNRAPPVPTPSAVDAAVLRRQSARVLAHRGYRWLRLGGPPVELQSHALREGATRALRRERHVILSGGDPRTIRNVSAPEWCVAHADQQLAAWNLERDELTIYRSIL